MAALRKLLGFHLGWGIPCGLPRILLGPIKRHIGTWLAMVKILTVPLTVRILFIVEALLSLPAERVRITGTVCSTVNAFHLAQIVLILWQLFDIAPVGGLAHFLQGALGILEDPLRILLKAHLAHAVHILNIQSHMLPPRYLPVKNAVPPLGQLLPLCLRC